MKVYLNGVLTDTNDIVTEPDVFTRINPNTYVGGIPSGTELVCVDENDTEFDNALVLYGFDEVGYFDAEFENPIYGFLSN